MNCSYSFSESNKHEYVDEYEADKVFVKSVGTDIDGEMNE